MPEIKTTVLPEHDDMLQRLLSVQDAPHTVSNFYPLILKHAGQVKTGIDVVLLLQQAIYEYAKSMPDVVKILYMRLTGFATALIDDEKVRNDALKGIADLNL